MFKMTWCRREHLGSVELLKRSALQANVLIFFNKVISEAQKVQKCFF